MTITEFVGELAALIHERNIGHHEIAFSKDEEGNAYHLVGSEVGFTLGKIGHIYGGTKDLEGKEVVVIFPGWPAFDLEEDEDD